MKHLYFLLFAGATFTSIGQIDPGDHGKSCVQAQENEIPLAADHPLKMELDELEFKIQNEGLNLLNKSTGCDPTIPVVFHIVDQNPYKVTDAQIQSALIILNEDFNKQNAEIGSLEASFEPIAANVNVQFKLAQFDESGNPTTGIIRMVANGLCNSTSGGGNVAANCPVKVTSPAWNTNNYLNIWIINNPFDGTSNATTQSGWAFRASSVPNLSPGEDGIVYNHRYLGTTGSSDAATFLGDMTRVLSHEVGHYLNLKHTFTGYCNSGNDDDVLDTPKVKYNNCGTSSGTGCCPYTGADLVYWSSCDGQTIVNYENYMDYSRCPGMFTNGQNVKIQAALASSVRSNLISDANQIATGVCTENSNGIHDLEIFNISVYPNPFNDYFTLTYDATATADIQVISITGEVLYQTQVNTTGYNQLEMNLDWLSNGFYFVKIESAGSKSMIKIQKH